jgi:hypothetical protein
MDIPVLQKQENMHFRQSRDDCRDYLTAIMKITCRIHVVLALAAAQCAHSSSETGEFSR